MYKQKVAAIVKEYFELKNKIYEIGAQDIYSIPDDEEIAKRLSENAEYQVLCERYDELENNLFKEVGVTNIKMVVEQANNI